MPTSPNRDLLVWAFPQPGQAVQVAYQQLTIATHGTEEEQRAVGDPGTLARPWLPETCTSGLLREQLWEWLDQVVAWVNHEYGWDPETMIPRCWPDHSHLVHEIAVLADLRRRAAIATTAQGLEDWHRYTLPMFLDRMRTRIGQACTEGHDRWPGRGRYNSYLDAHDTRHNTYQKDAQVIWAARDDTAAIPTLRAVRYDPATGEVMD